MGVRVGVQADGHVERWAREYVKNVGLDPHLDYRGGEVASMNIQIKNPNLDGSARGETRIKQRRTSQHIHLPPSNPRCCGLRQKHTYYRRRVVRWEHYREPASRKKRVQWLDAQAVYSKALKGTCNRRGGFAVGESHGRSESETKSGSVGRARVRRKVPGSVIVG
jgi:hypothetical protein